METDRASGALRLMLVLLWCFTLFGLCRPAMFAATAGEALAICGKRLIPSLFPLAAAGSVLAQASGRVRSVGDSKGDKRAVLSGRERICASARIWKKRFCLLFERVAQLIGISFASLPCLLLGLFAGFPVGAIIAASLCESGQIDSEEAVRLCCFTNNASAAFLVGAVGSGFFGSTRIGWLLWCAQTAAALTVGCFMRRFAGRLKRKRINKKTTSKKEEPMRADGSGRFAQSSSVSPDWGTVSKAIASSAVSMVTLTAFVVFFSVFTAFLDETLTGLLRYAGDKIGALSEYNTVSSVLRTLLIGLFEITGGMKHCAELSLSQFGKTVLAAGLTGWSGLSVFMQCLAAARSALVPEWAAVLPRRLAAAKGCCCLLTALWAVLIYPLFLR